MNNIGTGDFSEGSGSLPVSETERKFLIDAVPDQLPIASSEAIRQGYLAVSPDGAEVRLRERRGRCSLTVKSGGMLTRAERTIDLTDEQFLHLWPATEGQRLEKIRHTIPDEPYLLELDVYAGRLAGLVTVEVEFVSESAAGAFRPPDWFGQEVTRDAAFKNRNLALNGLSYRP